MFLVKHDWEKEPVFVGSANKHRVSQITVLKAVTYFVLLVPSEEYQTSTEPVFVNSASLTDLLAGVQWALYNS